MCRERIFRQSAQVSARSIPTSTPSTLPSSISTSTATRWANIKAQSPMKVSHSSAWSSPIRSSGTSRITRASSPIRSAGPGTCTRRLCSSREATAGSSDPSRTSSVRQLNEAITCRSSPCLCYAQSSRCSWTNTPPSSIRPAEVGVRSEPPKISAMITPTRPRPMPC